MPDEASVLPPSTTPPEVAIAGSIVGYPRDDPRARYLGYMSCGFTVREALRLVGRTKSTLSFWRLDDSFVSLENRIPEFRKELSKEYIELEFFRNFRLVLEKDYIILTKSLTNEEMTRQEHDYLIKLRSQYTPQQLQILEAVATGSDSGFNFARFVAENQDIVQMSRTDTVTMIKSKEGDDGSQA